jgi:hypothetical protein
MAAITLHQALEDVEVRFLYNLPESELSQIDRLFFQIEQAWWFYEVSANTNEHMDTEHMEHKDIQDLY